jgi:UDP-N-acetylmuramoyl-tripeptide--D-alanyl-D-alanine ligase
MLAAALGAEFQVQKSAANFNNEIGVPQTIFALEDTHTALVVEMGMRGAGQITELAQIAAPNVGVVTGIGLSHIELLGSQDAIAGAKGELLQSLPKSGAAIFPATDKYAARLRSLCACPVLTVAIDDAAEVRATNLTRHEKGWRFTVETPWGREKMFLPSPGRFNVQNALLAIAAAGHLGVSLTGIARALLRFTPPAMRLEVVTTPGGVTIIADMYNAAPDSMAGALETLRETPTGAGGRRVAVLGEMRELGNFAAEAYQSVGRRWRKPRRIYSLRSGRNRRRLRRRHTQRASRDKPKHSAQPKTRRMRCEKWGSGAMLS